MTLKFVWHFSQSNTSILKKWFFSNREGFLTSLPQLGQLTIKNLNKLLVEIEYEYCGHRNVRIYAKLMVFNGLKYHVVLVVVGEEIVNSSSFTFTIKLYCFAIFITCSMWSPNSPLK